MSDRSAAIKMPVPAPPADYKIVRTKQWLSTSGHDVCPRGWGWIPQSTFLLRIIRHSRPAWEISSSLCRRGVTTMTRKQTYPPEQDICSPRQVLHHSITRTLNCSPHQSLARLRVRTLGLSSAQTPKTCTASRSPHQGPDRLGVHMLGLSRAQTSKMSTPSRSPHQSPDRLGKHFGAFKSPNFQNVYSSRLQALVCRPCSHMLPATLLQTSCINSNTCPELVGITPDAIVIVRRNLA